MQQSFFVEVEKLVNSSTGKEEKMWTVSKFMSG